MPEQAGRPRSGGGGRATRVVPLGLAVVLGVVLPVGATGVAAAEEPGAPVVRCSITDPALAEISGLVDLGERMLVMNDGGEQVAVTVLDSGCQVLETRTADVDPYDPEDLALAADGTLWLADAGDNNASRATVALIALRPDGSAAVHRLSYPDGAHDSEALLLAPDGTPYLVTKEVLGSSGVYRPTAPLSAGTTVPMERVATVNLTLTGTAGGPVGRAGQLLVTGGAVAGDGHALALRTYTDAYVWPLVGSDVVGALAGTPARTALPESPQGEAISFTGDNRQLVVASEGVPGDVVVVPLPAGAAAAATGTTDGPVPSLSDLTSSERSPITSALIAAAVATVVVWVGSLFRRRPKA
ncbi:hypothetical protein DQ239_14335 [Blastococcus sp. TF02-09]|uniref:hypothetical protein n=1 Tax=Blastococcus sp. TF02-09 TaxID=2250576 RepID=UPI000DE89A75|nr:hypothetical protein [Blastococcus sp. TF02-9]RBY76174.1 hypothetical protein DQ239_14335 [Blastococcus sp. TF02-9]